VPKLVNVAGGTLEHELRRQLQDARACIALNLAEARGTEGRHWIIEIHVLYTRIDREDCDLMLRRLKRE
jgi:hypothetical protein